MAKRVAVVTGSNKGIGFGIVRALCNNFAGDVFLTSRDETRGKDAVKLLVKEGLKPKYHQFDITDHSSIVNLRDFLKKNYQGLDCLVNNAGFAFKHDSTEDFGVQAEVTSRTNYFGTLDCCEVLFPILKPHARVCNVSSMACQFAMSFCSDKIKARFKDPNITMEELTSLINEFTASAKDGTYKESFCESTYGMSKIGVTIMSMIQQRELDAAGADDIVVNACCPGYVVTDMTSRKGKLTIDQGAETPVYCAMLPPNVKSPRGKFIRDKKIAGWDPHPEAYL